MSMVRVRNGDTGAEAEVPESALPILRQSNWDLVPDEEAEQAEQAALDEAAAADAAMTEAGLAALPPENRPTETSAEPVAQTDEGKAE